MEFNTRVVAFLSQLGYQEETPESIAAACKGNLKRVWEFLLDHALPKAEKQRIDRVVREYQQQQELDSANASKAAQAAALRTQLHALRQECAQMERMLMQQQEELRLQANSVVDDSGECMLADQEQRDAELMTLALGCFTQRCTHLARLIAERREALRAAAARAHARQQPQHYSAASAAATSGAAAGGPSSGTHLLDELQHLVDAVREEMQLDLEAREDDIRDAVAPAMTDDLSDCGRTDDDDVMSISTSLVSSSIEHSHRVRRPRQRRTRIIAGHAPSPVLAPRLQALQRRPPAQLLAGACSLAERSVSRLRGLLASGEAAAAAANAAVAQMPRELRERRMLLPWTASPADAALIESGGAPAQAADADELIRQRQQAHVRMYLDAQAAFKAAAAAQARLEGLLGRPELAALQSGATGGASATAALWLGVQSKRAQVAALSALQQQLLHELRTRQEAESLLQDKWAQITWYMEEYQRQAALLCYLSNDSVSLSSDLAAQSRDARGALAGVLAPGARAAGGAARGAAGGAAREVEEVGKVPLRVLGAGAGAAAGAVARFRAAAQQLCRLGSCPSAVASSKVGGAAAAAAAGAQGAAGGRVFDPSMTNVLEAASELDELAAIKCPAELLMAVLEGSRHLRNQQQLLSALGDQLKAGADHRSAARAAAAQLQGRLDDVRTGDVMQRLPVLEEAMAEGRKAKEFADGEVKQALTDWWLQPAQHLVPWITHEGRSCSEWLMEVQALHGRQRELSGGQVV